MKKEIQSRNHTKEEISGDGVGTKFRIRMRGGGDEVAVNCFKSKLRRR
ncbi:hypothetical protein SLEP1_g39363 [Rubroshorea leprosula]|uniref:Uncharacterized protein n=1 Tax=Rubroshorea leprosula TaxID=152421 RepID=A0AAV5L0G2_9ROSI|nr:hypothetical protein SLEP1_g39363 [Rubroshorea leprosula]